MCLMLLPAKRSVISAALPGASILIKLTSMVYQIKRAIIAETTKALRISTTDNSLYTMKRRDC